MSVVLVTGAGGFVGSAVVRRLVGGARFWDGNPVEHVVALLRPGGSEQRLEELPRDGTWSIAHVDVAERLSFRAVLEDARPRAVVHAALDATIYNEDDERLVRDPLETLLQALGRVAGSRLLQVGSAWVLASGDRLDESAPLAPLTPYARNKAREDSLLPVLAAEAGVAWLNLRLFNLFGRNEKQGRLLPKLVSSLARGESVELTHSEQIRDFNDVDVAARVFADGLAAPEAACGAVYHVGSGRGTTVREFALAVAEVVGGADLIRLGASDTGDQDLASLVADPTRAVRALGWRPDLDLEGRVREAVDWWLTRTGHSATGRVKA